MDGTELFAPRGMEACGQRDNPRKKGRSRVIMVNSLNLRAAAVRMMLQSKLDGCGIPFDDAAASETRPVRWRRQCAGGILPSWTLRGTFNPPPPPPPQKKGQSNLLGDIPHFFRTAPSRTQKWMENVMEDDDLLGEDFTPRASDARIPPGQTDRSHH
ncbi:hypothetical protein VUR80DRAFT_6580 [Thermomyces stellatus]